MMHTYIFIPDVKKEKNIDDIGKKIGWSVD